jgi:two-component system response regulator CpxR
VSICPAEADAILMVDDDLELCELLREYLGKEGYEVTAVHDWRCRACAAGTRRRLRLVILDVMLPLIDGFGVLRQLRRQSDVPVIMLTARAEERDRVGGFAEGADDYLVKPFAAAELLARIRAVQRRVFSATAPEPAPLDVGELQLDIRAQQARHRDRSLDLTPTEFAILEVLVRARGRIVSRDELSAVLYQRQATPFERSLDMHVSHLRKKLDVVGIIEIRTVRGLGYTCVMKG